MATKTDICNLALIRIGVSKTLTNVETDQSKEAAACRAVFATERDYVLREFPWSWATKYALLGAGTATPNPDWNFSYAYPHDAVAIRRITTAKGRMYPNPPAFRIGAADDGTQLVFTDASSGYLEYTRQIATFNGTGAETTNYRDPLFNSMLGWRLAGVLGTSLSRIVDIGKVADEKYLAEKGAAELRATTEAQKDTPIETDDESVKELVNLALIRLGVTHDQDPTTLAAVVSEARLTKIVFDAERDYVLRDFPWGFASRYYTPDVLAGSPSAPVSDLDSDQFAVGFSIDGFEATSAPLITQAQTNQDWIYAYRYPPDGVFIRRIVSPLDFRRRSDSRAWPTSIQFAGDGAWPPPFKIGGSVNMGLMQRGGWRETPTALNSVGNDFRLAQVPLQGDTLLLFVDEYPLHPQSQLDDGTIIGDYTRRGTDIHLKVPLAAGQRLRAFYWVDGVTIAESPVYRERPAGTIDDVNATFTLRNAPVVGSEMGFLNERLLEPGVHYTIAGRTITMTIPPTGEDRLRFFYYVAAAPAITTALESLEAIVGTTGIPLPTEPVEGQEMIFLNNDFIEEDVHYTLKRGVINWIIPPPTGALLRAIWPTASDVPGEPVIYSNELNPTFEYTMRVEKLNRWDASARSMLAWRIAAILAPSRLNPTRDPKKADMAQKASIWCLQRYEFEKTAAEAANLNEQQREQPLEAEWLRAR
jgi:hypothetical protein